MAAVSDCFTIGSIVACTTCFEQEILGEVLAFDQQSRMLILKCDTADVSRKDVYFVNLQFCSNVQVKKEAQTSPDMPPSLNLHRLSTRVRNQVEQKKRLISALTAGVTPEGQKLYLAITKTITEVIWDGPNIVVFNNVVITPPYNVENVTGQTGSRQLTYVKKIVEKHTSSNSESSSTLSNATSSTNSSSSSNNTANTVNKKTF